MNKSTLRPTGTDKTYNGSTDVSPADTDVPGVEPLENTPDEINLVDERLPAVLRHKMAIVPASESVGRKIRLPFSSPQQPEVVLPIKVREMLLDRPTPRLGEKETQEVPPPPPSRSKAQLLSFLIMTSNFCWTRK